MLCLRYSTITKSWNILNMLQFYFIGGGFGGKALDTVEASGVAAVAAWKYVI